MKRSYNATVRIGLAALCLLACVPGHAADNLLDVYRQARLTDPALRASDASRHAVQEARPQSLALLLPNIQATGNVDRLRLKQRGSGGATTYGTNRVYSVSLVQTLFNMDQFIQLVQANSRIAQAEADHGAAEQDLIVRTAEAYFNVLAAQDDLELARANKKAAERQLDQATQRFEVGLIPITDAQESEARYDLAISTEIQAESDLESARDALLEVTGVAHSRLFRVREDLELVRPDPDLPEEWVKTAMNQNLSVLAAKAAVETARQEIKRQRAGHLPTLDADASWSYRDQDQFLSAFPLERNDSSIGIQLNVPLYTGGLISSQTREARYRYDESLELMDQQRRITERQTRDAFRGVIFSISQVQALAQAVISTKTAYQAAEAGFEVGTRTSVDVLDAERERLRANSEYLRSRYDYLLNTLRLKRAVGTLSVADVERINSFLIDDKPN
jgi:outer membrane protein